MVSAFARWAGERGLKLRACGACRRRVASAGLLAVAGREDGAFGGIVAHCYDAPQYKRPAPGAPFSRPTRGRLSVESMACRAAAVIVAPYNEFREPCDLFSLRPPGRRRPYCARAGARAARRRVRKRRRF